MLRRGKQTDLVKYEYSKEFALAMDAKDPLKAYKDRFFRPEVNGNKALYFCGNSLGLQPRTAGQFVQEVLDAWAAKGVDGHFEGSNPWFDARLRSKPMLAKILGAKNSEVVAMNSLTGNLHLLMVSFYRPTRERFRILTEPDIFPSDRYMLESQVRFHGLDPKEAIVVARPRPGEHVLRTEDIVKVIEENEESLALVFMSGVHYLTGQFFEIPAISKAGRKAGARVGFDLAHAAGNVPLRLHEWEVDFAAWCSYKYLNSGPGNVAGIFVHEKHGHQPELPRLAGWWGHQEEARFSLNTDFKPMAGADGWQVSNNNVLALAAHEAALEIFEAAGMDSLRRKSELLTGYLEFLVETVAKKHEVLEIITPRNPAERGCQLSLLVHKRGKALFEALYAEGVVGDWRDPNVIRLAPTPLYNSFEELFHFAKILERTLENLGAG